MTKLAKTFDVFLGEPIKHNHTDVINIYDNQSVNGNKTFNGDVNVYGIFTATSAVHIHSEIIDLSANYITLNNNLTGAPSEDAGINVNRGTSTDAQLLWNETSDRWEAGLSGSTENVLIHSDLANLSGVWESTYSTVESNSAGWEQAIVDIDYLSGIIDENILDIGYLSGEIDIHTNDISYVSGEVDQINATYRTFSIGTVGSGADYECDGTADEVQFNQAITDMSAGDTLKILSGTYVLANTINVTKSIFIEGVDRTLSNITVAGNFNGMLLTASGIIMKYVRLATTAGQTVATPLLNIGTGAHTTTVSNCAFSGTLDIIISNDNNYSSIVECLFEYGSPLGTSYAIYPNANVGLQFFSIHRNVFNIPHYGFSCLYSNSSIYNIIITENIFSCYYPIMTTCPTSYFTISDNYIKTAGNYAISIADTVHANTYCQDIKITDNIIENYAGTTLGIEIKSAINVLINGNLFQAPSSAFNYITLSDGAAGQGVIRATIVGNTAQGSTSGGVVESGASDYNILEANNNLGTITLVGANSENRDAKLSSVYSTVLANSASWEESADINYISGIVSGHTSQISTLSANIAALSGDYSFIDIAEVSYNPVNYSESTADISGHLYGIDIATGTKLATSIYQGASGVWQGNYSTTLANSGRWESAYTKVNTTSANWSSAYSTLLANSASWEESADITALSGQVTINTANIASLSGDWSYGDTLELVYNPTNYTEADATLSGHLYGIDVKTFTSGLSGARPSTSVVGYQYFDTSLGMPIWSLSADFWVNATGAQV